MVEHTVLVLMYSKSVVALAEETDPDMVPPPLAQRQNQSVSGTKRKMLHDPIAKLFESSNLMSLLDIIEPLDSSDKDSGTMEIDGFEEIVVKLSVKAEVKVEKALCTTSLVFPPFSCFHC